MIRRPVFSFFAVALFGLSSDHISSASAQGYLYNGLLGWPNGFYQNERIPYFSLHPPVYYSAPVPRTYGWSPWAYPPGVQTPEIADCDPLNVENPHVEKSSSSVKPRGVHRPAPATDRNASYRSPQVIYNPYYESQVAAE
jgi:hypothetical protein